MAIGTGGHSKLGRRGNVTAAPLLAPAQPKKQPRHDEQEDENHAQAINGPVRHRPNSFFIQRKACHSAFYSTPAVPYCEITRKQGGQEPLTAGRAARQAVLGPLGLLS